MDTVSISLLQEDEIETLQKLAESIWRVCYKDLISTAQIEYMLNQRYQTGALLQCLARGDRIFTARMDDQMVGFAHAYITHEGHCKLDKLYVSTDHQRHGIGARLVGAVEEFARQQRCEQLILRVYKGNQRALGAYRKYGFTLIAEFKEEIGNGFVMDDCVMGKHLQHLA